MLIDPWGKIVESLEEGEGVLVADLSLPAMEKIRNNLPALKHRKLAC
jgi:nitrilase